MSARPGAGHSGTDRTWLFVGMGVGCGFVVIATLCLSTVACYACSVDQPTPTVDPYPYPSPTPYPIPDPIPPPPTSVLPPPPTTTVDEGMPPLLVRATIDTVTGTPGVSAGQTCEFHVERRDREDGSGFWCNAQIVCGGQLLYGGPTAGFFPCTLFYAPTRGVVGSDPNTTAQDRDAAMSLDTQQMHLEIWDDAQGPTGEFRVVAHLDSVE